MWFVRISLELLPTDGDRLEGRLVTDDGRAVPFSGTFDLLRAIEEAVEGTAAVATPQARKEGSSC